MVEQWKLCMLVGWAREVQLARGNYLIIYIQQYSMLNTKFTNMDGLGNKDRVFCPMLQKINPQESSIFSDMFYQQSYDMQFNLEMFQDTILRTYQGYTDYLLLDNQITFGYELKENKIWFKNRQCGTCEYFSAVNGKNLPIFVDQLRRRCSQQGFLEKYDILEEKGKGVSSSVFTAKRVIDQNIYAIKKIKKYGSNLWQQIQILQQLEHPNLVYFREFFIQSDNTAYIVMDYEDGGSLLDLIHIGVQLQPKQKIKIITDMLNGLQFLRIKGIVHKDLKPENILYSKKDGNYKIGDFGLSRKVGEKLGNICGTPGYIAPELFNQNDQRQASIKSDIYSMGLVLYQVLTFQQYYEGQNNEQILKKNMQHLSLKKKSNKGFKINSMQYSILQKMIRSDPEHRKNSCQILKSSYFRKVNKAYSLQLSSSTNPSSPNKKNDSDKEREKNQQDEINEDGIMNSFLKMLRMRSWSN